MPLQSKRTVRVHEIPAGTSETQYLDFVEHLCTKPKNSSKLHFSRVTRRLKGKFKSKASRSIPAVEADEDARSKDEAELGPPPSALRGSAEQAEPLLDDPQVTARGWTKTTYCHQNGHLIGTVSFESEILKMEALERHEKDKKSCWKDWVVEDNFGEVTVLYEGPDAKFDICAVHGQDGNAMDTWTAGNGKMWLRDLLPQHENFKNSRIMTFGYDSDLTDKITVMGLNDWAATLLRSLDEVRTGDTTLQPFNPASVWDAQAFIHLKPCPPFRCFAEGRMMRVGLTDKHVVTLSSASLGNQQAFQIMAVDHVSICKFTSRLGPFTTISMALWEIFGQPRFQAHAYPPDRGFWWEGTELNGVQHWLTSSEPFFGRSVELSTLESSLAGDGTRPSLTVVKGIGGIGKTELLLQFAATQKDRRNVFFLGSQDGETIDSVLSNLSTRIGFDMLEGPGDNQERWRNTPVAERIQIFMMWLGHTCNKDSLFIIDDIEAFGYSKIPVILRYPAQHTLISTRDSNLKRADRVFRELRLSPLGHDDTIRILESTLESLSADPVFGDDLGSIARIIQGHPLAARNAIPFAIEHLATYDNPSAEFSKLFEIQDPEERRVFLEFTFEGRSLWDAFDTSLERLKQQDNTQSAASLLQILPFLSFDNDCMDEFLKMDKRLPLDCERELPDMAVFRSGYTVMSSWLSKLRGVSFYLQNGSPNNAKSLNIHPLVLQYMLLHIDMQRRVSLMRQLLHLLYNIVHSTAERESQIKPHVQHCTGMCRGLGVSLDALDLPDVVLKWVMGLLEGREEIRELGDCGEVGENPFDDPVELSQSSVDEFITLCFEMREKMKGHGNMVSEGSTGYRMIADCKTAYKEVKRHIGAQESLTESSKPDLIEAITVFKDMLPAVEKQQLAVTQYCKLPGITHSPSKMEPLGRDSARLLQLLQSFQCQKVPCDLLIRACESRPTWSSAGEITERLPPEAGVSEWLLDLYNKNKAFFHGTELVSYEGYINYTIGIDGVAYLEVTTEEQHELEVFDERNLARERIAISLQAFPSQHAEIIGEEIIQRLMDILKTSILPLLSCLTEADIEDWLLPKTPRERESFLVSMAEFLYQGIDRFGIQSPLIPSSIPRHLCNVIANQRVTSISIDLSGISQVLDAFNNNSTLQPSFRPARARTNQRSNALMGYLLSMLLSDEGLMDKPKAFKESLAGALSDWQPLSLNNPSTMEYLAATTFCSPTQINMIVKPSFVTVDTITLHGLLLSQRKKHKDATEFLNLMIEDISSLYGPCSMQLGIVTAELANCYNIIRQEDKAEVCVRITLQGREGWSLSTRRDKIYLDLALADSLIGRARYSEAVPLLESIVYNSDISAAFRMMSTLRLAKSRRRMNDDTQGAFEHCNPLRTSLTLLSHIPRTLTMEYVEELACGISETQNMQLEDSEKVQDLIGAVNSTLGKTGSLTDSPSWDYFSNVQQEYSRRVSKYSGLASGKQEGQHEKDDYKVDMGIPVSSQLPHCFPLRADIDMSDEKGP
ncbi:hypothetical protein FCOIX_3001 [Fusarium coicis]|nr:hypothetical protein FCOIX_3001 [Fusarium coicis]